jgi:hypothetical protein
MIDIKYIKHIITDSVIDIINDYCNDYKILYNYVINELLLLNIKIDKFIILINFDSLQSIRNYMETDDLAKIYTKLHFYNLKNYETFTEQSIFWAKFNEGYSSLIIKILNIYKKEKNYKKILYYINFIKNLNLNKINYLSLNKLNFMNKKKLITIKKSVF